MKTIFSSTRNKILLSLLLILLLSLPFIIYLPRRLATSTSPSAVQKILANIKEMNYYPENAAWTKMWIWFSPTEMDRDFANIQRLGFNTVRIILQAEAGVFDYPVPTTAEQNKLSQVITLAAQHHLKVHLSLFDGWDDYQDIVGSRRWADAIVKPYAADPRINILELQNEMPLYIPGSIAWAQTMIPYLQNIGGGIPVTISESGFSHMQKLVNALRFTPPDFYDFHLYEYDGQMYNTLKQVKIMLQGAPLLIGEIGYSTYPQGYGGFSYTAHNSVAQEAQQAYYYRMFFYATKGLGLPPPAPWTFSDFSMEAFPGTPQLATLGEAYYGLFRGNGSEKPAATTIASLLAGNPIVTSFNNSFEQSDGHKMPTLWRIADDPSLGFTATIAWDPAVAHSGKASVKISHSTTSKHGTAGLFINPIQYVIPGQTYSVSAWAKGLHSTGSDYLSIVWVDVYGHIISEADSQPFPTGTYNWQPRTLTATAPPHATAMEIHLNSRGNTGTAWFDDVSFS
jgi:hypothetical protein